MSDIDEAFEQCPDCGRYVVQLGPHRCRTGPSSNPKREQRIEIAAADTRHDDDLVAILPTRGVDGSYAYHETDAEGLPRCGGGGSIDDDGWRTVRRAQAKARGKSPCKTCLRVTGGVATSRGNGSA